VTEQHGNRGVSGLTSAGETGASRFRSALTVAESIAPILGPGEIPDALGAIERLRAIVDSARLTYALDPMRESQRDKALDVTEAAERLGMSESWLYREASRLPFTIRNGRKLGFSAKGIADYLRRGGDSS
jgi:predicted DNA-binding transcriptional regulator AlpA